MASNFAQNYIYDKPVKIHYEVVFNDKDVSVNIYTSPKHVTIAQAESSLVSTISFIITVALTLFINSYPLPKRHT